MTENTNYKKEDKCEGAVDFYENFKGLRAFDDESMKLREYVLISEEADQAKEYRPSLEEAITRCIAVFEQLFKNTHAIRGFHYSGFYYSDFDESVKLRLAYLGTLLDIGSQEFDLQIKEPRDYVRDGRNGGICLLSRGDYRRLVQAGFVKKHPEIPLGSPDALDTEHIYTMPVSDGACGDLEEMNIFVLKHAFEWLMYVKYLIEHKNDK
jgi:hypothetical protein